MLAVRGEKPVLLLLHAVALLPVKPPLVLIVPWNDELDLHLVHSGNMPRVQSECDRVLRRTTLSLSLTVSDKKKLKMMAMEQDTTIAALIHGWIAEHSEEVDG